LLRWSLHAIDSFCLSSKSTISSLDRVVREKVT
jgi:hypothetical protein